MRIVAHAFNPRDVVAGHVALDFVNTVTARDAVEPRDWLDSYERLLGWAALIAGRQVISEALALAEVAWKEASGRATLAAGPDGMAVLFAVPKCGLDLILDVVMIKGVDLLVNFPAPRARVCEGPNCGWLFVDTSKAGRRIWCDMATCGNDAKGRRHRARTPG